MSGDTGSKLCPNGAADPQAAAELARVNRALRLLSSSNQALIHIADEAALLQEVCRIIVDEGGYRMAVVLFAEHDEAMTLRPAAHAGFEAGYTETMKLSWSADSERGRGPAGIAVRTGQTCMARDIPNDPAFAPWRDEAQRRNYRSVIALPLRNEAGSFGVLAIFSAESNAFDAEEVPILDELSGDLAFGITALRAGVERMRTETALSKAQQMYRDLVENSPDVIVRYDREGRRTYVNPEFERVNGLRAEDVLGKTPAEVSTELAPRAAVFTERLMAAMASGRVTKIDLTWRKDDKPFCWFVRVVPEFDAQGTVVSALTIWTDVTESKQAEEARAGHARFLESMDRVNRAIQGASDLEQLMGDVLDVALSIFECDRASLAYPCDPAAASWRVPMERNRAEFPGLFQLDIEMPMTPEVARTFQGSIAADGAIRFGAGSDFPSPPEMEQRFGKVYGLAAAIFPKLGKPWEFMLHECSGPRMWTAEEERLFLEIGRRLADGLTSLLAHRNLGESETRLRTLVQTIPDLVWLKDPQGVFLGCNPQFARLYGASENEIVGRTDYDFVSREVADSFRAHDREALTAGVSRSNEEWLSFAGTGYRGLLETIRTPMPDQAGKPIGVLGIARDITERHRADEQLRIAATAFEAQEGIVITDADRVILKTNRAFTEITGYTAEDAAGRTPRLLQSGRHDADFYREMWQRIVSDGSWQGEIWNRRKNGEIFPEWLTITAVGDSRGEITHYVGTLIDITARKAAEKEIEYLAFYDLLTKLPNRRLLLDRLQQALAGSARSRRKAALLFIDLDNFKILNDTSGHDVGDQLLVEVARRLATCVRDGDTVARLGGYEFVVMLEDLSHNAREAAAQAKLVGEKILSLLGRPYAVAGREHHSTPSIGATLFSDNEDSVDELLKQADIAMYQAKAAGRNTLRFFDPDMQAALAARALLEAALRLGIHERQFVLHYQPQVDGSGRIIGAEALLRWQHPERGMVSPAQFIPVAEETALILPIGQWVLECACRQLNVWARDRRCGDLHLSINVSARQFRQGDFVDRVRVALNNSGAPAERLKLELTESLVLDNIDDTIDKMHALKALGVGFSMDDFGTGYSSLAYLTRLPLDQLKIDQSFVRNLPDSANDAAVVQTIITLARSLGLAVIAEGVETEAQRQFLEQHGCPTYQGYLASKPVPLSEFEQLLKRR
jgi:diguanylate cyclase (GGDEF)-like protein/PAS domain S-box-containing protein